MSDSDQVLISLKVSRGLEELLDMARGGLSRSHFIRDAIVAKIKGSKGVTHAQIAALDRLALPPDRKGKGGRPSHVRAENAAHVPLAAETSHSPPVEEARSKVKYEKPSRNPRKPKP